MSWVAVKAAFAVRLGDPTAKQVLVALAFRADPDGKAWPSIATLAEDTELAESTVHRAVSRLVRTHQIEVIHRKGRSSVFMVDPGHSDTPPLSQRHPTPVTVTPRSSKRTVKGTRLSRSAVFLPGTGWVENFGNGHR